MQQNPKIEVGSTCKLKTVRGFIDVTIVEIIHGHNGTNVRWTGKDTIGISMLSAFLESDNSKSYHTIKSNI